MLIPISVTSEIARLENKDGQRLHDYELAKKKVQGMSKITLASSAEVWLINLPGESFNHFYNNDMEGLGLIGIQEVFLESYEEMKILSRVHGGIPNFLVPQNFLVLLECLSPEIIVSAAGVWMLLQSGWASI